MLRSRFCKFCILSTLLFLSGAAVSAEKQGVAIATNDRSTIFYSVATAIGQVLDQETKLRVMVTPYKSPEEFLPLLAKKQVDIGMLSSINSNLAFVGPDKLKIMDRNPFLKTPNLRVLMLGY